ncbi:hypothetical protein SAMN04487934_10262 [Eubacterium ruminantium]|nr:hypothetical protein SAMN04487934_10262 [Eubacterium ruminantium]
MRRIGICDRNVDYAFGLADYLCRLGPDYKIHAFTEMKKLEEYLQENDIDLILTDDISVCDDGHRFHKVKCIYMSDNISSGNDIWGCDCIFKYQNLTTIAEEIRKLTVKKMPVKKEFSCEAVFSPIGRCGCTTLAKALADNDGSGRGLYIAMENYCGQKDLTKELLYQLKERFPDFGEELVDSVLVRENKFALILGRVYQDLRNVQKEDIVWMNEEIRRTGNFSSVIYDLGSAALTDFGILSVFERIYMPVLEDEISVRKVEHFEAVMRSCDNRDILANIVRVKVPYNAGEEELKMLVWRLRNMWNEN